MRSCILAAPKRLKWGVSKILVALVARESFARFAQIGNRFARIYCVKLCVCGLRPNLHEQSLNLSTRIFSMKELAQIHSRESKRFAQLGESRAFCQFSSQVLVIESPRHSLQTLEGFSLGETDKKGSNPLFQAVRGCKGWEVYVILLGVIEAFAEPRASTMKIPPHA